ncbi:MAG TPA: glycoside hydrolase domain-containing protein [Nocardioidaceae bacterium]|nr:glycoside hydrolase domain-containing protein [Nocardioidaceae bacterium]
MLLSALRRATTRAVILSTAVATAVAGTVALTAPAQAANRVTPGSFSGYGFDQCETQSQEVMDAWLTGSPYWAVGIYIAGENRHCGDDRQVHLTSEWVSTQLANGWKLLPITVGPQAPCYVNPEKKIRIDNNPADDFAAAREQGGLEAVDTVTRAQALGIAPKSTLWNDIEAFDTTNTRCRNSTLAFLSGWTEGLHSLDYVSGVYMSAARGMNALDDARVLEPGRFTMPDRIWVAEWVKAEQYRRPPLATPPSLYSAYLRDDGWFPGGRMRQYRGGHDETYGGETVNIDTNYLELGRGTRPGRAPRFCGGTVVDFPSYRRLGPGAEHPQVSALQCLLKRKKLYGGEITGVYDATTTAAVRAFRESRGQGIGGRMLRKTWTTLLSEGRGPVLKVGSGGQAVRRLQRALNAAVQAGLAVDGLFGPATTAAVREYQEAVGLRRTGVAAYDTWAELQSGAL